MTQFWTALCMCLGMFTILPLTERRWNEELRSYSTACLPLAGLAVGLIWWGGAALARWLLPEFLAAAATAALPFVLSGFIHLDGFMDTSDALLSWRDRETRLKILKDVHVGSFAAVMLSLLILFQFAACMSVERLFPLCLIPVLSRACSAFSVMALEPLGHSEYAGGEQKPRALIRDVKVMAGVALLLLLVFSGWRGLLVGLAVLGGYALSMRRCVKSFGGVSGDLAGFALTISELCGLVVLAIL